MRKSEELAEPNSCLNRARDDELLFVLLERDRSAPAAVRAWIIDRVRSGKNTPADPEIRSAEAWITNAFRTPTSATAPESSGRPRGPLDAEFEDGYVPMDEPPGLEEREYAAWKAAGGKVRVAAQPEPSPPPAVWAVVELMGHARHAGRLSEEEKFGGKLGRVDVPDGDRFVTLYFGAQSVYRLTICDEATARREAESCRPRPAHPYEMPLVGHQPFDDPRGDDDYDDEHPN